MVSLNIHYDLNVRSLRSPEKFSPIGPLPSREGQRGGGQGFDKTWGMMYNGGMKREAIGEGVVTGGPRAWVRGRSLIIESTYRKLCGMVTNPLYMLET